VHVSLAWLGRHVDLDGVNVEELADRFTLGVAELEGVTRVAAVPNVVVGRVLSVEPIAGSKLTLCQVDVGKERRSIVCGAPNVAAGQCVLAALPGSKIQGQEIVARAVKGVGSEGMLVSEQELGIGPESDGILVLDDRAQPGTPLSALAPIEDVLFEIDNKSLTHRPDLWGHRGIAREVGALLKRPLKPLELDEQFGTEAPCEVAIEAPAGCAHYSALALAGIATAPSPLWLRVLLYRVGTRPIDNVVDATNFVMLDLGNPVHAFDRRNIEGGRIVVRRARDGERIVTLDGVERSLDPRDLVIADAARPVALAGIMGGEDSGVTSRTSELLFEAATFDAATVRVTAQRLGLRTEASARFEKSLDPALPPLAVGAFLKLMKELCPGVHPSRVAAAAAPLPAPTRIALRLEKVSRRLGVTLGKDQVAGYLSALEFDVNPGADGVLDVTVPSFRATKDVTEEVDLIEEVGRSYGYNNIVPEPPTVVLGAPDANRRKSLEKRVRSYLTLSSGFDEVLTYSFAFDPFLERIGAVPARRCRLKNPISAELSALRTDLCTGLVGVLDKNAARHDALGVFELGRVFLAERGEDGLPLQPVHLAALVSDAALREDANAALFFRLKGAVIGLFAALERARPVLRQGNVPHAWAHPARQARVELDGRDVGYVAELHPLTLGRLERPTAAAVFELDFEQILEAEPIAHHAVAPPPFPPARRDFAVVVPEAVRAEDVHAAIAGAAPEVADVGFQSFYRGAGVPEGQKSLAWSVVLRHSEHTLDEAEVQRISDAIVAAVARRTGGRLR
jgi:phenylalanyl-tRNA synthetase beta chain